MEEYPNNSMRSKETNNQNKQTDSIRGKKVVTGNVKTKKKSELMKIVSAFMPKDIESYKQGLIDNTIIPGIRNMLTNSINSFFDEDYSARKPNGIEPSYRSYYNKNNNNSQQRASTYRAYAFDDPIFDSRYDAQEVLDRMHDIMIQYKAVSVADFYDLAGITHNYTDNKYGWTDISSACIMRSGDGYYIRLPKALPF